MNALSLGLSLLFCYVVASKDEGCIRSADLPHAVAPASRDKAPEAYRVTQVDDPFACTAILKRWSDGSIQWVGCPTYSCGDADECVAEELGAPGGYLLTCRCQEWADYVLCKGWVYINENTGEPMDEWCENVSCSADCLEAQIPPPPEFGSVSWYLCKC